MAVGRRTCRNLSASLDRQSEIKGGCHTRTLSSVAIRTDHVSAGADWPPVGRSTTTLARSVDSQLERGERSDGHRYSISPIALLTSAGVS